MSTHYLLSFRRGCVAWTLILLLLLCLLPSSLSAEDGSGRRIRPARVLVINSYHLGFHWTDELVNTIARELSGLYPNPELFIEYMDSKRFPACADSEGWQSMLEHKYRRIPPDLIIVSDDAALSFIKDSRERLFPGVPVVFCGINDVRSTTSLPKNFTGIIESLDIPGNLELILRLFPKTREIAVITDGTPTGLGTRREVAEAAVRYPDLEFRYLNGEELTMKELIAALRALPRDCVAIAPAWYQDKSGRTYSNVESYPVITGNCPVPVVSTSASNLGLGVIGGKVNSGEVQGGYAALLTRKLLSGTVKAGDVPVETASRNMYIFDARELERFRVPEKLLPRGSRVLFRRHSFYRNYRSLVWTVAGIFTILITLVTGLAASMVRRRRSERELEESRRILGNIINNIPARVFWKDTESRYLGCNQLFAEEAGRPDPASLIGDNDFNLAWHEQAEAYRADDRQVMSSGEPKLNYEEVLPIADGQRLWVCTSKVPLRDKNGKIHGVLGCLTDITARKLAIEALRKSEERYRVISEQTGQMLYDYDLKNDVLYWNGAITAITGYSNGEFSATPLSKWLELVHPDDRSRVSRELEDARLRCGVFLTHYRIIRKDGNIVFIEEHGVFIADDNHQPFRMLGTLIDVSERKQNETAIRQNEENLRVTLNSIGDAVIATDTAGHVTRMNIVAEKLTAFTSREASGLHLSEVFRIVDAESRAPVPCPAEKALATGGTVALSNHCLLLARDGGEYRVADSAAPICNDDGGVIGVVLVFRDITSEYAVQEQLRQSQKMDAIGQLAGGVAHDFNNVLGGIMGAAEILKKRFADNSEAGRFLDIIINSTRSAADLTSKLLTYARKQPARNTVVDLARVMRDALAILERTIDRRISITTDFPEKSLHAQGDPGQLQSAFLNLLINAAQAMPNGGSISVSMRRIELEESCRKQSSFDLSPGTHAEITISDTGHGISPEHLDHIFEPFFTTKEIGKGTGLGLAAVFGTVRQHHGEITVNSQTGHGTSFTILLPLNNETQPQPDTRDAVPVKGKGRILVADDEPVIRDTAAVILEDLGYEVVTAENGRQALELFRRDQSFDLVILDMIMPEMNGRDCFEAMRGIRPDIPVLLSSGYTRDEDLQIMSAAGLNGFIRKPFSVHSLSLAVSDAMSSAPSGNAIQK